VLREALLAAVPVGVHEHLVVLDGDGVDGHPELKHALLELRRQGAAAAVAAVSRPPPRPLACTTYSLLTQVPSGKTRMGVSFLLG